MKAYKGFNKDLTCRGVQYEEGKTFETDKAELCETGFHACENPLDCFSYYSPTNSEYHEVELDDVSPERKDDSKVVAKKITIGAKINLFNMVQAAVEYIKSKVDWDNAKESNSGDYSVASNTGYYSVASNTGYYSVATNSGNRSVATNSGNRSVATNSGNYSVATNTGNRSVATNSGDYSVATNKGNRSVATNSGDYSVASNTGYYSVASNTGYYSVATNSGNYSAAEVSGKYSIAIVTGKDSKARGALGDWLVLTERDNDWQIKEVRAVKVDGEKIKADTWYQLVNGEITECNNLNAVLPA